MKKQIIISIIFLLVLPLISSANYGSGTYSTGDYNVGEVVVVPPPAPSDGGGGGCTYNWDCTNWFPLECPESGIRERICSNRGTCTGIVGMPNQTQNCIYEGPTEPIFDIFLSIPQQYTQVCSGSEIKANIKLKNYGKVELLDAFMTYWILNENNSLIAEVKDTRAVEEGIDFETEIKIPESTPKGIYRLYAQITYAENKTAVAGESFEVMEGLVCQMYDNIQKYVLIIFIGFVFIIITILIIKQIKKKVKKEKEIPYEIGKKEVIAERKMEPEKKKEIVSQRKIKTFKGKISRKKQTKSAKEYPKSSKNKEKLKNQMFEKLLEETVKLKKKKK